MAGALSQATPEVPRGYPTGYETSVRLADHRKVTIRPVLPSDAAELAEAIRTADEETLRTRFMGGPPPLTDSVLSALTVLDYDRRFALVARDTRARGVGIARYAVLPPSDGGPVRAEVAVAVDPAWRRVGLATILIKMLARRAVECGIDEFTASFIAENRPVSALADESYARTVVSQGVAELRARLGDIPTEALAVPQDEAGAGALDRVETVAGTYLGPVRDVALAGIGLADTMAHLVRAAPEAALTVARAVAHVVRPPAR